MPNEKMMILKMLEEGKITADEASRLLDSAGKASTENSSSTTRSYDSSSRAEDVNRSNSGSGGSRTTAGTGTSSFDDFAADMGRKFETFTRDMEPKLQKFTEVFAEKTVNLADKLSKTLNTEIPRTTTASTGTAGTTGTATTSYGADTLSNFEMQVTPGYNELSIAGLNGEMRVKGYNGDKITAKVTYTAKRNGASIELMKLGSKYYLHYDEDDFKRVNVDMYVPESMFNVVNISNINGLLDIASIKADSFVAQNTNGSNIINEITADAIKVDCSNGKLDINSICGRNAEISNFNSPVEAGALDVAFLKLENGNAPVNVNVAYLNNYTAYLWAIETSNAKLTLNMPTLPTLGYHIKAMTSLGTVKLGLTGMSYITNDSSSVEARSIQYDTASKKMQLSLETSNGGIHVN